MKHQHLTSFPLLPVYNTQKHSHHSSVRLEKNKVVPVLNQLSTMRDWKYSFTFLDLSTRKRCVVSYMLLLLYPNPPRTKPPVPTG